jgi:protein ImuB
VELLLCRERTERLPAPLRRLGLTTLGDVVRIGRGPLGERFGVSGVLAYDLASGLDSPLVPRVPGTELRERFELPESLSGQLLDRVLGLLLDRLLARPERDGRTLRTVVLEAALVEGGTWRTRVVLREATADRERLGLALAPHLAQLSAPAQSLGVFAESFGGPPSQALPLLQDDEERRRARLREGLRQVSAGSGEDALLRVVEVDPASRLPERRMALAPRET